MKFNMIFLFSFLIMTLSACAPPAPTGPDRGQAYAKIDLSQKETCSANQACSTPNASCISVNEQAYCFDAGSEVDSIGCTHGKLIILQSMPGQAACF